jgi:hypothetical protein
MSQTMLRRRRLNLIRIALGTLAVLAVGAALLPATGVNPARAASSKLLAQPPTLAQLQARADRASEQAGAARRLADRAAIAAASAAANLRDAEATLAGLGAIAPTVAPLIQPSQPPDCAVAAAQSRLQLAQQQALQAETSARLGHLNAPPGGLTGGAAILDNMARQQAENAQSTVITAQRNLAAAQQSASMGPQAANLAATLGNTRLRTAQRAVAAARRLAVTTANAARIADRNAQTLAEAADRARAAANAAMVKAHPN